MFDRVIKLEPSCDDLSAVVSESIKFHSISKNPETISIGDFATQTEITVKKNDIPLLIATLTSFHQMLGRLFKYTHCRDCDREGWW